MTRHTFAVPKLIGHAADDGRPAADHRRAAHRRPCHLQTSGGGMVQDPGSQQELSHAAPHPPDASLDAGRRHRVSPFKAALAIVHRIRRPGDLSPLTILPLTGGPPPEVMGGAPIGICAGWCGAPCNADGCA